MPTDPDRSPDGPDACPRCGEEPTDVHARGPELVLVPCGHAIDAMTSLDVPPGVLEGTDGG